MGGWGRGRRRRRRGWRKELRAESGGGGGSQLMGELLREINKREWNEICEEYSKERKTEGIKRGK